MQSHSVNAFVIGGTFDPPGVNHLGQIREVRNTSVLDEVRFRDVSGVCDFSSLRSGPRVVVIAPTLRNPWKEQDPTLLELRLRMAELILRAERIPVTRDQPKDNTVFLSAINYVYAKDFVLAWRERYQGTLTWVVGPDIADEVCRWKDWTELEPQVPVYVSDEHGDGVHATQIREGQIPPHKAIRDFMAEHGLYPNAVK